MHMRPAAPPEAWALLNDRLSDVGVPEVIERGLLALEHDRHVLPHRVPLDAEVKRLMKIPDEVDHELHGIRVGQVHVGGPLKVHELLVCEPPVEVLEGAHQAPVVRALPQVNRLATLAPPLWLPLQVQLRGPGILLVHLVCPGGDVDGVFAAHEALDLRDRAALEGAHACHADGFVAVLVPGRRMPGEARPDSRQLRRRQR
mmetsp:Transcript_17237/g.44343  ORF Transcript_17237/g.44343 Transcript_17237/m.44343 type:complete len:201 (-) Transcript_17237:125-727(-)